MNVEPGYVRNQLQHILPAGKECGGQRAATDVAQIAAAGDQCNRDCAGVGTGKGVDAIPARGLAGRGERAARRFGGSGADAGELVEALHHGEVTAEL